MHKVSRRNFLKSLSASGLVMVSGIPIRSWGANAHVVIIGGGTGGATAAKYLKKADPTIRVTLIEKNARYYTCYMSNEVLGGERKFESLGFDYTNLRDKYGINIIIDEVVGIDAENKIISTQAGTSINYDRCIVSPGVDFRYELIEGYDASVAEQSIHHSWKAGAQTIALRKQLEGMENGGTFVLAAPPNPYRCPPAPYERASQIAHYFKHHKPASKIIILDPKTSFAKQALFEEAWMNLYGYGSNDSMIDWVSGPSNLASEVNVEQTSVTTLDGVTVKADVLNIIPAQKAGKIAFTAGLTDDTGWCPIKPDSFESTLHAGIHIIGDSSNASPLPKSGFAANSEAKACALAIAALLNDREPSQAAFTNGCYSVVGDGYAISIVANYALSDDHSYIKKIANSGGTSPLEASDDTHAVDVQYAYSWYNNFTKDVFK